MALNPKRLRTRPLRSGGESSLYVRGVSLEHIRLFGRWSIDTFRRYRYRDNQISRHIGSDMFKAVGMLGHLQMSRGWPRVSPEEGFIDVEFGASAGGSNSPDSEENAGSKTIETCQPRAKFPVGKPNRG